MVNLFFTNVMTYNDFYKIQVVTLQAVVTREAYYGNYRESK